MPDYTLTIKIAEGGTEHIDENGKATTSAAGHMWYSLSDGEGNKSSYGFASDEAKAKPFGKGQWITTDDATYQDTYYTVQIPISEAEYKALKEFGEAPKAHGFDADRYNALNNSCIDFTWKALETAGLNEKCYEGKILPTSNAKKIDKEIYEHMFKDQKGWSDTWNDINKNSKH
ncbi:MAG: calcium-binding protein, partial [Campylobacteraceae bacterium]|nr:calcium-binding protein [Campylobacteraceae bacterium]